MVLHTSLLAQHVVLLVGSMAQECFEHELYSVPVEQLITMALGRRSALATIPEL